MFHCVLYQPEILPNTGNLIRLCANSGIDLHLIQPLGFSFDDRRLRRAGLDYHEWAQVRQYASLDEFYRHIKPPRLFACSTKAQRCYSAPAYAPGDAFLFGPETRGLPPEILAQIPAQQCIRIPMRPTSRSLNLANAAAIILYEAWRQLDFSGS
jgi:tRNA (cytidine/uridine-2'-O-)-methyltransferase